jgi:N-acetylglucosamine kinase-like BadF-type ATPase
MAYYLGIDIGGSKTESAVGDGSRVLGNGRGARAKLARVTREQAGEALRQSVERACAEAGIAPAQVVAACVGTTGASRQETVAIIQSLVSNIVPGPVQVVGDMEIAHRAAFEGRPGVVVISGTGSIAYGVAEGGQTARAGGWGAPISDEGSGDWIGRTAVSDALLAHDSAQHSFLLSHILEQWRISIPAEIARIAVSTPPPDFAALFPYVAAAAERGDAMARDLLVRAAHELAQLAMIVVRRLWPAPQAVDIALSGGVFENSPVVQEVFTHILATLRPDARVALAARRPVEGALMLARSAALTTAQ